MLTCAIRSIRPKLRDPEGWVQVPLYVSLRHGIVQLSLDFFF